MLHHLHCLTNLEVKVTDFEILRWSFWLKGFGIGYLLNLWMDLVYTIHLMLDIGLKFYAVPPPPHLLTDLEVKVTDLEFFMIKDKSISHQSVIRKYSSFKYKNLGGSASIP